MENLIPYIKLIILALVCLVTGVCTLSRNGMSTCLSFLYA